MAENQFVPEFLAFNTYGLRPTEVSYQLDVRTVETLLKKFISEKISGVEDVKVQYDHKGRVGVFAWFNGNSDHFNDHSTENTMIKTKLSRLDKEMQDFLMKFGWCEADDDPRSNRWKVEPEKIIVANDNPEVKGKWVAVHLSVNPFLEAIFDIRGEVFRKTYNQNVPKAGLQRKWLWLPGNKGKYTTLTGLKVIKKMNNPTMDRGDLHAKWSGKF